LAKPGKGVGGAVYLPVASIVPILRGLTPTGGINDQVTAVFVVPVTIAVNCWTPFTGTVTLIGSRLTEVSKMLTDRSDEIVSGSDEDTASGSGLATVGEILTDRSDGTVSGSDEDTASGPGLATVIMLEPACEAIPVALSCDGETKFVVRGSPFHKTFAPSMNSFPFTVRVKAPGESDSDVKEVRVGVG